MEPLNPPSSQTQTQRPGQSHLTPQFCFNTTALRDFLRLSRSTTDDSLSLHLNALLLPSSQSPFNPSSTSVRPATPTVSTRRQIPSTTCATFKQQVLFPSWQMRSDIITYCQGVAERPEAPPAPPKPRRIAMPSDRVGVSALETTVPDKQDLQLPALAYDDRTATQSPTAAGQRHSRNYWGEDQIVDPRTDPYSARDYSYTREGPAEVLKGVLEAEESVERIVRARTWSLLGERCLPGNDGALGQSSGTGGYEAEWANWRMEGGN